MPKYDIKRGTTTIASVIAEGSQNIEAMGVNDVTMKFTLITPVVFQVGDWCSVYGNKYIVYRKPEYMKINERQHEYDLYLVHEFYKLQDSLLMGVDKNATLNEKQFYLTGNLQAFADLVLLNANRNDSGWTLGTVETTGAKTLQFDGENILASLNRIAAEFETEFWIEGKVISLAKRLQNSGITLSYGENKGLISITKGNKDANATIFTRLFVEGSERNLPSYTNYGFKRLQLPASYNGKVDNASAIAQFGIIENYVKLDDIFPQHTGTVTAVGDEFTFYDANLPFDVNAQLLPGVTAYVTFQSGNLAGYNFDIESFDNTTKKFTILENEDEKAATLPNSTLRPAVGDTYIIFDIQMPQSHITAAENELLTRANELLAQGSDIDFNDAFTGVCDPLYFKRNNITPILGQYARLFETNPAIDVTKRMSKISRDLQNEWKYDITFTDKIQVNTVVREYIKNIEETLVINETVDRTIINRDAVRRAAQRIDILRGDIFDPDGYFDGTHLKPQTIEAIMATFGYKSGNFALEGVAITLNAGGVSNNFNITAGKLIHFSYDIGGAYVWDMGSMTSAFTDSAQGYYIYAKISKTALTGAWVVNNQKLQVDNEEGYYTLLIGRVYPVVNGKREIDLLYGVTNIVGNRIQTGIIQDLVGNNYWNLDTGQMRITGSVTIVGTDSNVYTKNETNAKVDVKNTNHITQPTNYIAGDTWELQADTMLNGIQYKAGDILTTLTSSTSFVSAHWAKRVRYVGKDDIKIGGRNLLVYKNINNLFDSAGLGTMGTYTPITNGYRITNNNSNTRLALYWIPVEPDTQYTFSAKFKKVSGDAMMSVIVYQFSVSYEYLNSNSKIADNSLTKEQTVSVTITTSTNTKYLYVYLTTGSDYTAYTNVVDIREWQLEAGNVATDFTLSQEDLEQKLAKLITLSGATQIIKVDKNGNKTPASSFTVTGTAQNTTITTWEYNVDGGGFGSGLPTGVTRSSDIVTIDPAAVTFKTLSIRASDGTYSDVFTVGRAVDGADGAKGDGLIFSTVNTYAELPTTGVTAGDVYLVASSGKIYTWNGSSWPPESGGTLIKGDKGDDGESGYTVLLSNESHTFAGSETAAIASSTTCDVITYKGDSSIAHTISIGTLPTGLTATVSGSTITFTASTSLTTNGTVDITINADGKTFVRKFSFAISFKGVQGKSVTSVDIEFSKTNSATVAPAGGWNTIAPTWEQGYWIWQRTKTTYSDGTSTYSPANNPSGQIGQAGADGTNGRGIASMTEQYYLSTSKTTQTGGAWVDNTAPTWEQGKYLWSRLKIVYTNPTETVYTEPLVSDEWEAVNAIKIGGRNLIIESEVGKYYDAAGASQIGTTSPITNGVRITNNNSNTRLALNWIPIAPSIDYVFSVKMQKISGITQMRVFVNFFDQNKNVISGVDVLADNNISTEQWLSKAFITPSNAKFLLIYIATYPDYQVTTNIVDIKEWQLERGNKAGDWNPSVEDQNSKINQAKLEAQSAANLYSDAKAIAVENAVKAHADGIVTAEEQSRISADNTYLQYAKNYADASDAVLKVQTEAYADGKVSASEQATINTAYAYADVKKAEAQAYADGKVTAEETRAINDAIAKLNEAKAHAALLDSQIQIGGRNLIIYKDIIGSYDSSGFSTQGYITEIKNGFIVTNNNSNTRKTLYWIPVLANKQYTASVKFKKISGNAVMRLIANQYAADKATYLTGSFSEANNTLTTEQTVQTTFTTHANAAFIYIFITTGLDFQGYTGVVEVKEWKLEAGNKATDFSMSPEDTEADIKKTMDELASFSNDGILKPVEKSGLKTLMDDIAKAHAALLTRAANYPSVSTTLLASSYASLTGYINPLLASMTTDSSIDRATYDNNFSNYFTQRKSVEENIEAANKTNTDAKITFFTGGAPSWGTYKINDLWRPSATQNIDGVQFLAGEVYRCVSVASAIFGQNWKVDKSISSGTTLPSANTAKVNDLFIHEGDGNKVYQFTGTSWVVKADTRIQTALENANAAQNAAASKTRIITSTNAPSGTADVGTIWQRTYTSDGKVYIKYYRYDGTAWNETSGLTSASYLEQAIAGLTEVSGGLSLGHVFAVRNSLGQVTGYINGQDGNPYGAGIMLAAGVNNFGLSNETQNIFLKHDGSAKIGKMTVDVNGNITGNDVVFNNGVFNNGTFNGTINSSNGAIGALNINTSGLFVDSNAPADSSKDKFYLKRVGNNVEFKIYNESLVPLYDGNGNVIGYSGSNKGMSYTPATGLVINSSNHVLGSYSTNQIAIRVLSGHLYFDRLYDSGSTDAYGRVRWKYDVDGDKVLFIDGSNL